MDPNTPTQQNFSQPQSVPIPGQAPIPLAPPPTPNANPTKRSVFSVVVIIVFILAAVLIAIGGYIYIVQQTQIKEIDLSDQAPNPTPVSQMAPSDTAWKTYVDHQLGFSIQYPPELSPEKCFGITNSICTGALDDSIEPLNYTISFNSVNPEESVPGIGKINYTQEDINGISVLRTTMLPSAYGAEYVFIKNADGNYIQILFSPYSKTHPLADQSKYYDYFNQMLSTFTFTNEEN